MARPCLTGKCPYGATYWKECELHCAEEVMEEKKEQPQETNEEE